jgi:predicted nucleic acid-binding protein
MRINPAARAVGHEMRDGIALRAGAGTLARGLVLVTSNDGELERISGLAVENWR